MTIKAKQKDNLNKKQNKKIKKSSYGASQITVLEGLAPVRKRPAMYIGSTGARGLHHLIWECVDNGIDEAIAGYCNRIEVELLPESSIRVSDNGRGIPVDIHKQTGVSALEVVMTKLHAGAKFGSETYKVSGGLHGVGISVVNALSSNMKTEVSREGKLWVQEYKNGNPLKKVKAIGKSRTTGTTVIFQPDFGIFDKNEFKWNTIISHLRQQAYLTSGLIIKVIDSREKPNKKSYKFYFEGGVSSFVRHLNRTNQSKHENIFYMKKEIDSVFVEIGLQYTEDYKETIFGFANNIYTSEGGTHISGFRTSITRTLNNFAREKGYIKEKDSNLTGDDVREGLTAVVSVRLPNPQFEGQTKAKLGNSEARAAVDTVFSAAFKEFLDENPKDFQSIIQKCILASNARKAARTAKEAVLRKGVLDSLSLPGKLADCSSKKPEKSELFIVEGDSAGGSCKMGRDRNYQAILPLRGKILNVQRARLDKILANQELKSLVIALGTGIGEQFNIEKLRYHKIILMADADSDGMHIKTLLLTFFYHYFLELIKKGYVYVAMPPLYRLKKGKKIVYVFTEEEKERELNKLQKQKVIKSTEQKIKTTVKGFKTKSINKDSTDKEAKLLSVDIQRYKGLGEMNPDELFDTTMDPEKRLLKKIEIENLELVDEVFEILMGKEVATRKRFIQTHAKTVKNLDI